MPQWLDQALLAVTVYVPNLSYPSTNMALYGPGLPSLQKGWNFLYSPSFIKTEMFLLFKFSKMKSSDSRFRTFKKRQNNFFKNGGDFPLPAQR